MAYSYDVYTDQDGSVTDYVVSFGFISRDHVTATVDGVDAPFTWLSDSMIRMDTAPVGDLVISRSTPTDAPVVTFVDGSTHSAWKHNTQNLQLLYITQEAYDSLSGAMESDGSTFDAEGQRIVNVADPENNQDVVTKAWAESSMSSSVAQALAAAAAAEGYAADALEVFSESAFSVFNGSVADFQTSSVTSRGTGTVWFLHGDWGVQVFTEVSASGADFVSTNGVGIKAVGDTFDVRAWGLLGVGDETAEIEAMAQWASDNGFALIWPRDITYEISEIDLYGSHRWTGARIHSNKTSTPTGTDFAITFNRNEITEVNVTSDFNIGRSNITVDDPSLIEEGDLLRLQTTRLIPTDDRGTWTEGQIVRAESKASYTIRLTDVMEYSCEHSTHTGTITAISADRYTLTCSNMPSSDADRMNRRLMKITSGDAAGEERYIVDKVGSDAIHYDTWNNEPWPATLQVGDSYEYSTTTTALVYRPNTIVLEDCQITRDVVYNATAGDRDHYGGVHAVGALFTMRDSVIDGFPEVALRTSFCYKPLVENCELRNANLAYNDYQGLGYGWLVSTCHAPKAVDVTGFANRSNINFSGSTGYTTHGQAVRVTMVGGGKTYAGEYFWPTGNHRQAVASSHGTGLGTQYIDCVGRNVYAGHTLVGHKEQVKGYRHFGAGYRMVWMGAGAFGATITDIAYDDQVTMPDHVEFHTHINSDKRLQYAVGIEYAGDFTFSQPITIRGVRANSVIEAGVLVETDGNTVIRDLHVSDVYATCYPDSADAITDFRVVKFDDYVELDNCTFDNLKLRILTGSGSYSGNAIGLSMVGTNTNGAPIADVVDGGLIWIDGKAWIHVLDGGIVRVPLISGTGAISLNVSNARTGAGRPQAFGLFMENQSSTNSNTNAYLNNIELIAAWPTTSSAASSGNVGLHYNRANGSLSVVNNSGADQTLIIEGL